MLTVEERLDRLIVLREVVEVIPFLGHGRKEVYGRLDLYDGLHQAFPVSNDLLPRIAVLLIIDFQPFQIIDGVLCIPLEILHDDIFVIR